MKRPVTIYKIIICCLSMLFWHHIAYTMKRSTSQEHIENIIKTSKKYFEGIPGFKKVLEKAELEQKKALETNACEEGSCFELEVALQGFEEYHEKIECFGLDLSFDTRPPNPKDPRRLVSPNVVIDNEEIELLPLEFDVITSKRGTIRPGESKGHIIECKSGKKIKLNQLLKQYYTIRFFQKLANLEPILRNNELSLINPEGHPPILKISKIIMQRFIQNGTQNSIFITSNNITNETEKPLEAFKKIITLIAVRELYLAKRGEISKNLIERFPVNLKREEHVYFSPPPSPYRPTIPENQNPQQIQTNFRRLEIIDKDPNKELHCN